MERPARRSGRVEVVVIAVSTGGPVALMAFARALPRDCAVPILIAQHMLPAFVPGLAASLQERSDLLAVMAEDGMLLRPGCIYLAPGNHHLVIERAEHRLVARLDAGPPENGSRPSADPLFRSAARVCGAGALGVVMTGLGADGLAGSREILRVGGQVYAQDEATSAAWGMPGAVVKAGLAERVLPLDELASAVAFRVAARRQALR